MWLGMKSDKSPPEYKSFSLVVYNFIFTHEEEGRILDEILGSWRVLKSGEPHI